MRILFVSRKYPPSTGGMQTFSFHLHSYLKRHFSLEEILPENSESTVSFIYKCYKRFIKMELSSFQLIYFSDLLPAVIFAPVLKKRVNIPICATVHGLDLIYPRWPYPEIVKRGLPLIDKFICVSKNTADLLSSYNIPSEKIEVVPNGVKIKAYSHMVNIRKFFNIDKNKIILLTVGRLIKRKGVQEFIKYGLPYLGENYVYIVVGEGPLKNEIKRTIKTSQYSKNVILTGEVGEYVLPSFFMGADIFVMPNIRVKDDVEGFGIVALEATWFKLPVIAFGVDGVQEAVVHEKNGIIVRENDYREMASWIKKFSNVEERKLFGENAYNYTVAHFHWQIIGRKYVNILEKLNSK